VASCLFLYQSNFIRVCFSRREEGPGNPQEEEDKAKAMPGMVKETKPGAAAAQDPVLCSKVPTLVSAFVDSFVDFVVGGQILGSPAGSSLNQQASRRFTRVDEVHGSQGKQLQQQQNKKNKERGMLTTWLPAPERLIAIGDLHGDLSKTRAALGVAQVIDKNDHWIGGKTVVVQVRVLHPWILELSSLFFVFPPGFEAESSVIAILLSTIYERSSAVVLETTEIMTSYFTDTKVQPRKTLACCNNADHCFEANSFMHAQWQRLTL
jgi:hypothetical protein